MGANPLNVTKWAIHDSENAKYCTAPYGSSSAGSFQLYIPTLMPLIPGPANPTQVIGSLSSSCFLNDQTCMPSVARTIRTQNYKTVPRFENRTFRRSVFYQGANIMVEVHNFNVDDMSVTNKIDESTDPPIYS